MCIAYRARGKDSPRNAAINKENWIFIKAKKSIHLNLFYFWRRQAASERELRFKATKAENSYKRRLPAF